MYFESWVAALAILVWANCEPGWLNVVSFNLALTAGFTTIVFNANPLMRLDGYYIVTDALGLANLYTNGQGTLRSVAHRICFGKKLAQGYWTRSRIGYLLYGFATAVWRTLILVGLLVAAIPMFYGWGWVLAMVALSIWLFPLGRGIVKGIRESDRPAAALTRVGGMAIGLTASITLLTVSITWPGGEKIYGVVRIADYTTVRSPTDGFVSAIGVRDGESIHTGRYLLTLENSDLSQEVADLEISIKQSLITKRHLTHRGETAKLQAAEYELAAVKKRFDEKQRMLDELIVHNPQDGDVIGRETNSLEGQYVAKGTPLCTVGKPSRNEIRLAVPQRHEHRFRARIGQRVEFRIRGSVTLAAKLKSVSQRASRSPIHEQLCAPYGGPLAVKRRVDDGELPDTVPYEYLEPHFVAVLLVESQDAPLYDGQLGKVTLYTKDATVGRRLYADLRAWIMERMGQKP